MYANLTVSTECFSAKHDLGSLDFTVTRLLIKLFKSSNVNVIDECKMFCNFMLPGEKTETRRINFENKILNCNSLLYYCNRCPDL